MLLNCLERVMALQVLSTYKEGSFITFKILGELRNKLGFKEPELTEFEIKEIPATTELPGQITWNDKGNKGVDIKLTEKEIDMIKQPLVKMDENGKLTEQHLSLYMKIVEPVE